MFPHSVIASRAFHFRCILSTIFKSFNFELINCSRVPLMHFSNHTSVHGAWSERACIFRSKYHYPLIKVKFIISFYAKCISSWYSQWNDNCSDGDIYYAYRCTATKLKIASGETIKFTLSIRFSVFFFIFFFLFDMLLFIWIDKWGKKTSFSLCKYWKREENSRSIDWPEVRDVDV